MAEKKIQTRIRQKVDTKANWDKATNFVPLKGEYIYYSDLHKVKVGDGVTKVGALPFLADSDSKVTSAANHYTPTADSSAQLSVDASSTTAATWNSTSLVTGVNLQRDAKGHVTGVTVDSIKMPANPNTDTKNTTGSTDSTEKLYLVGAKSQAANPQTYSNSKVYTQNGKLYSNNTEVSVEGHTHDSKYVKKSGDTITGKLTVQSGDASGCLQIGADVASNTLTAGTRKLARMTFPTREYDTTKTCSIMSCDNMNNYNYVEFGGHIGDATNTAPDYMCFNVDKTHNSLSPATKECVMAISPSSLKLFSGALDAGQISSFDDISGKWVFNNANTFKNSGFTYTLPNKTGTVALKEDFPKALKNPNSMTIKAGADTVSSYDGSAAKTFTVAASTTAGAFTISDGTTTKTVQLAGKFTDNNTTYSAGTGLQLSGTTFSAKLNSTTSLGTIGSTSKLYAVGVDANGELAVNVPWTDAHQSIKALNTNNTSAQTVSSSEAIAGSGTINLHKVAKTGSYNDLNNKPTIPTVPTNLVTTNTEQTISGTKNFGAITANTIGTGTNANNYFQSQKFRGEGDAATYYHAVDFGYAGHDQVDFYEYGGIYNFYRNQQADTSNKQLLLGINPSGIKLPTVTGAKVLGTNADGQVESHTLGIADISSLQSTLDGKLAKSDLSYNASTGVLTIS